GEEPMTSFSFSEDYDNYGNPLKQISIVLPKGKDPLSVSGTGEAYFATLGVSELVHKDESEHYLIGRPVRSSAYEIVNNGTGTVYELKEKILKISEGTTFPLEGTYPSLSFKLLTLNYLYYDGFAYIGLPF